MYTRINTAFQSLDGKVSHMDSLNHGAKTPCMEGTSRGSQFSTAFKCPDAALMLMGTCHGTTTCMQDSLGGWLYMPKRSVEALPPVIIMAHGLVSASQVPWKAELH
jgi:hypothetical protein